LIEGDSAGPKQFCLNAWLVSKDGSSRIYATYMVKLKETTSTIQMNINDQQTPVLVKVLTGTFATKLKIEDAGRTLGVEAVL